MSPKRPVNFSAVSQHLEETAFYWQQRQSGLWSPTFEKHDVDRIEDLIKANLRGLRAAGDAVIEPAIENMLRWHSAGGLFVLAWLAITTNSKKALGEIDGELLQHPDLLFAAESALYAAEKTESLPMAKRWLGNINAALRAASIKLLIANSNDPTLIEAALNDVDQRVAARAIQAVGENRLSGFQNIVERLLDHVDPSCRIEAAISLRLFDGDDFSKTLIGAIDETLVSRSGALLSPREPELAVIRRAIMCWSVVAEDSEFNEWVDDAISDDGKSREAVWALAFRGTRAALERLADAAQNPELRKLVGYAAVHITGVDLQREGLLFEEGPDDAEDDVAVDAWIAEDDGLEGVDPERFGSWIASYVSNLTSEARLLNGSHIEKPALMELLESGWQPQRWNARAWLAFEGVSPV